MNLTTVKVKTQDLKRIRKLRVHETEPRWAVIQRALDKLEAKT